MGELLATMGLGSLLGASGAGAAIAAPEIGGALSAGSLLGQGGLSAGLAGLGGATASTLGPTIGAASMLGAPSLASKFMGGVLQGGFPGMASNLASQGLGKVGMTGASNLLAENPIALKMGIGNQQQAPSSVTPPHTPSQPIKLGQSPISAPQKTVASTLNEMVDKKLEEFVKQYMQSQR